ncbi:ankyrin repeat domain-containing protein [Nocardia sp. NPDC003979]
MTAQDEWGRIPLHYAARDGDTEAIGRLLATQDVNATDAEGWTPLHFAAQAAHPLSVEMLLKAGADVHALTDKGHPAIYMAAVAASGDPVETIRVLRAHGADPTRATMHTYFGPKSPLHFIRETTNNPEIQAEFRDLP